MDGYLLVDKPTGMTSFGVVARVRHIATNEAGKKVKTGHTGTLDPAASGLMILVLGKYTKKAGELSKQDKAYEAELTLGSKSSTADREGEITKLSDKVPTLAEATKAVKSFIGNISQTPPAFSAIKVDGQRAYKLARAGKPVDIKPRQITIHRIVNIDYNYPILSFTTSVSSGTYIRTLAEDIGKKLGTGAYLSALRRISVGEDKIENSFTLKQLDSGSLATKLVQGLPKG